MDGIGGKRLPSSWPEGLQYGDNTSRYQSASQCFTVLSGSRKSGIHWAIRSKFCSIWCREWRFILFFENGTLIPIIENQVTGIMNPMVHSTAINTGWSSYISLFTEQFVCAAASTSDIYIYTHTEMSRGNDLPHDQVLLGWYSLIWPSQSSTVFNQTWDWWIKATAGTVMLSFNEDVQRTKRSGDRRSGDATRASFSMLCRIPLPF